MEEYEYSFEVEDIAPYIAYCENDGYKKVSTTKQNRMVYENKHNGKIIARLTTECVDGKEETFFDCKNVGKEDNVLKVSCESEKFLVDCKNKDAILSILEVMDFCLVANNIRTRYEYRKNNVTFEIDEYISPKMKVVAVEGKKEEVDKVYAEIRKI